MASIFAIRNAWRDNLIPAAFRGAQFHCEAHSLETGRRMVQHQFPKRDTPIAEDMGHQAIVWTVRGYVICYPRDVPNSSLYRRDYRTARDELYRMLATGQSGLLQVQTLPPFMMWCQHFKMTEEEKLGGYAAFDMTFIEAGTQTFPLEDTSTTLINTSQDMRNQILAQLAGSQGIASFLSRPGGISSLRPGS
jgi:hypothetical protein